MRPGDHVHRIWSVTHLAHTFLSPFAILAGNGLSYPVVTKGPVDDLNLQFH